MNNKQPMASNPPDESAPLSASSAFDGGAEAAKRRWDLPKSHPLNKPAVNAMTAHETTPSDAAIAQAYREVSTKCLASEVFICGQIERRAREIEQGRGADGDALCDEIERDEAYDRDYIPLPGGWEIQTRGNGSTFRILNVKTGDRLPVPDSPYLHETLTLLARDINKACRRMGNRDE